jgi:hypothetical protein
MAEEGIRWPASTTFASAAAKPVPVIVTVPPGRGLIDYKSDCRHRQINSVLRFASNNLSPSEIVNIHK